MSASLRVLIGLSFKTVAGSAETITVKGENTDLYIWALFTLIPHILGLVSLIPYIWYDLTGKKLENIRNDLRLRHEQLSNEMSGGNADA